MFINVGIVQLYPFFNFRIFWLKKVKKIEYFSIQICALILEIHQFMLIFFFAQND